MKPAAPDIEWVCDCGSIGEHNHPQRLRVARTQRLLALHPRVHHLLEHRRQGRRFRVFQRDQPDIAKLDRGYPYYPVGDAENEKRLLQWNPNFEEQH